MTIQDYKFPNEFPVFMEKNFFLYPFMIVPLFTGDKHNIEAIDEALKENTLLMVLNQKKKDSFFDIGVLGNIMRKIPLSDGKVKVLFQGLSTAKVISIDKNNIIKAKVDLIPTLPFNKDKIKALSDILKENVSSYARLSNKIPSDLVSVIFETDDPYRLSEIIASSLQIDYKESYKLFAQENISKRLTRLVDITAKEVKSYKLRESIKHKAHLKMEKHNKEYLLKEQLKEINKELNHDKSKLNEITKYKKKLKKIKSSLNKNAYKEISKQIERFASISYDGGSESSMLQNYIEISLSIPFGKYSNGQTNIDEIKTTLDKDHYSLKDAKDRILEHFAVKKFLEMKNKKDSKNTGNILCFVGPPGVGKTSLANSIANTLKRKLVRVSLGGLDDVNELRGHRRTYIGAMCGRIVNGLIESKEMNPVIVLDEIDKLGHGYRGDPSAVFLEILDPEQNSTFRDHFLNFDVDLSKVLFIATANDYAKIPYALRDRFESIFVHSYTPQEKFYIAKNFLLPQEMKKHALNSKELSISDASLRKIIDGYTKEAGVRNLRRQIAKICRKSIKLFMEKNQSSVKLSINNIEDFLEKEKFDISLPSSRNKIGLVNGLAWTAVGGDLLHIESLYLEGKGAIHITGNLGNVMKESSKIALSVAKKMFSDKILKIGIKDSHNKLFNIENLGKKLDLHIHVPEGATPKDGPSAGITIACAIASLYSQKKVNRLVAMTGELNLNGDVLSIGGLKEKLIAAFKAGIKVALIPRKNYLKDLEDIPNDVKKGMEIIAVDKISDVLEKALV